MFSARSRRNKAKGVLACQPPPAQISANRSNSLLSTGPITDGRTSRFGSEGRAGHGSPCVAVRPMRPLPNLISSNREIMNRRKVLLSLGALGTSRLSPADDAPDTKKGSLPIEQFQPRSMLHAQETKVPRAAYPVIDLHTHITHAGGLEGPGKIRFAASADS